MNGITLSVSRGAILGISPYYVYRQTIVSASSEEGSLFNISDLHAELVPVPERG